MDEGWFGEALWESWSQMHAPHAGHANQDSNAVARDQIYIVRNTTACPNKLSSSSASPAPSPSSLSQLVMSASSGG